METVVVKSGLGVDTRQLQATWNKLVDEALADATLTRPATGGYVTTGKTGVHSEHLGFVLAEMQSLARAHPQATW
jgi:ring-1,2-phenylacetyl-CoA epoxidase subunit PaaC